MKSYKIDKKEAEPDKLTSVPASCLQDLLCTSFELLSENANGHRNGAAVLFSVCFQKLLAFDAFRKQNPAFSYRVCALSDLGRIQTCNLLSRNQMRYSVAPRGLIFCFLHLLPAADFRYFSLFRASTRESKTS